LEEATPKFVFPKTTGMSIEGFFKGKREFDFCFLELEVQIFHADEVVDSFEFFRTPFPLLAVFGCYLWIIFKVAPAFMKGRKPLDITRIIQAYNIFQVVACTYIVVKSHDIGFSFKYSFKCVNELSPGKEIESFNAQWWFIMLRVVELIETVFFILRKKQNQVSVLHVYHHITTIVVVWTLTKYNGGK
jgi:elongation of very long chain fatty acids protein 1